MPSLTRRDFTKLALTLTGSLALGCQDKPVPITFPQRRPDFTEWGWPTPYRPVSPRAVAFLKSKGWWPLTIGHFADIPAYAAFYPVVRALGLLEKRGIEVKFQSFLSGPPIVESFVAGQTQVSQYGDFPFWSTADKGNPVMAFGLTGVNLLAALLVRPDSPLRSADDIKTLGRPAIIATTLGSLAEFYLAALAMVKGLEMDRHIKLAGMTMRDAQLLPKGVDAVAVWEPHVSFAIQRGLGRVIDTLYPYYFTTGIDFVRREIHEEAPEVVQALADATTEALLFLRYRPDQGVAWFREDRRVRSLPADMLRRQIDRYVTAYKPTFRYIHADFWAREDERVALRQHQLERMTHRWTAQDLRGFFAPSYLAHTFDQLGWAVPKRPVFLPSSWQGEVGRLPYPPFANSDTLKGPQPFPEAGDLIRPWYFDGQEHKP